MTQMMRRKKILKRLCLNSPFLAPTEGLWGFSGVASNIDVCHQINYLKQRTADKSFIVLYHALCEKEVMSWVSWEEVTSADKLLYEKNRKKFITYLLPASKICPKHLIKNGKLSLRYIHCGSISKVFKDVPHPIVSTSANKSGSPTITRRSVLQKSYPDIFIYPGRLGGRLKGSSIIDLQTKERLR